MATAAVERFRLSDAQKEQCARDGFVLVRSILTPEEVDRYKRRAREIAHGDIPPGGEKMIVRDVRVAKGLVQPDDPEKGLWKLLNPGHHDETFRQYPFTPKLLDVFEELIGPDIQAFLLMMIYKPPGLADEHPWHQDAMYFPFGPHDLIWGSWVALDPTDAENGTISVIPGSHKLEVLPHGPPKGEHVNYGVFGVEGYDDSPDAVVLNLEPGDGAFFHSRTLHRTGRNLSQRHRRVLTVHAASSKCQLWNDHHKALDFKLVRGRTYPGCIQPQC